MTTLVVSGADWYDKLKGLVNVDFHIFLDGKEVKLSTDEVLKYLKEGRKLSTSQVTVNDFLKVFRKIDDDIICLCLSSRLSGTYSNAVTASKLVRDKEIVVIDSGTGFIGLGYLAKKTLELINAGEKEEKILSFIEKEKKRIKLYGYLPNMKYVGNSGRIPEIVGKIGNFLGISAILSLRNNDVKLEAFGMFGKDLVKKLHELVADKEVFGIGAAGVQDLAEEFSRKFNAKITPLNPAYTIHLGEVLVVGVLEKGE